MTKPTKEMIPYLASLSRIGVKKEEEAALLQDISKILNYFAQLNEVDTSQVEPCTHLTPSASQTPLREDIAANTLSRDTFLHNAPDKIGGLVRVPPVLKQE